MPENNLSVNDVLKMAQATAQQHLNKPLQDQLLSPKMVDAIEQVWDVVKVRISDSEADKLDDLIKTLVQKARGR
jgi:hypothetical protein